MNEKQCREKCSAFGVVDGTPGMDMALEECQLCQKEDEILWAACAEACGMEPAEPSEPEEPEEPVEPTEDKEKTVAGAGGNARIVDLGDGRIIAVVGTPPAQYWKPADDAEDKYMLASPAFQREIANPRPARTTTSEKPATVLPQAKKIGVLDAIVAELKTGDAMTAAELTARAMKITGASQNTCSGQAHAAMGLGKRLGIVVPAGGRKFVLRLNDTE